LIWVASGWVTGSSATSGSCRRTSTTRPSAATGGLVWAFGCTGKFAWPIPDRGLRDRLHRISARTLIVWGREDKLAHVAYAGEFANGIAGSARAPRTGQVRLSVLLIAASSPRPPVR